MPRWIELVLETETAVSLAYTVQ